MSRSCFIAFAFSDRVSTQLVTEVLHPLLLDSGWRVSDIQPASLVTTIYDHIATEIRKADLVLADVSAANPNVIYEVGIAHGWGKRTILFSRSMETLPFDLGSKYPVLLYSRESMSSPQFVDLVSSALEDVEHARRTLVDPSLRRYMNVRTSIGIEIFDDTRDPVRRLQLLANISQSLGADQGLADSELVEIRTGSLGAWISLNVDSITRLIEKILFFVPEWRKKNAERLEIEGRAEMLFAQAEREYARAHETRRSTKRSDARFILDVLSEAGVPARITLGDRMTIDVLEGGRLMIGLPSPDEADDL